MRFFVLYTIGGLELEQGPFNRVEDANSWADEVRARGASSITVEAAAR